MKSNDTGSQTKNSMRNPVKFRSSRMVVLWYVDLESRMLLAGMPTMLEIVAGAGGSDQTCEHALNTSNTNNVSLRFG